MPLFMTFFSRCRRQCMDPLSLFEKMLNVRRVFINNGSKKCTHMQYVCNRQSLLLVGTVCFSPLHVLLIDSQFLNAYTREKFLQHYKECFVHIF